MVDVIFAGGGMDRVGKLYRLRESILRGCLLVASRICPEVWLLSKIQS